VRARAIVSSHRRVTISHASRNPSTVSGRMSARSGMRRFSSASTNGAMSTPLITTFDSSPSIVTSTSSTPLMRTPWSRAPRTRVPVKSIR
jgi:hypothetical protein